MVYLIQVLVAIHSYLVVPIILVSPGLPVSDEDEGATTLELNTGTTPLASGNVIILLAVTPPDVGFIDCEKPVVVLVHLNCVSVYKA